MLKQFKKSRTNLITQDVGNGLTRLLYSTFLSYYRPHQFNYALMPKKDKRGAFVEFIKTLNNGQFSYLSIKPNQTRGGHYHHIKSEKFLVIKGKVLFEFNNINNNESFLLSISEKDNKVVDTIPGWSHYITNKSNNNDAIILLWANEIFDKKSPDTFRVTNH